MSIKIGIVLSKADNCVLPFALGSHCSGIHLFYREQDGQTKLTGHTICCTLIFVLDQKGFVKNIKITRQ